MGIVKSRTIYDAQKALEGGGGGERENENRNVTYRKRSKFPFFRIGTINNIVISAMCQYH